MTDLKPCPGYAYKWKGEHSVCSKDHPYLQQPFVAIGQAWQNKDCWVLEKVDGVKVEYVCYHFPCSHLERWPEKDVARLVPETRTPCAEVVEAAKAVIERWKTPLWKDVPATAEYINRLEIALALLEKNRVGG